MRALKCLKFPDCKYRLFTSPRLLEYSTFRTRKIPINQRGLDQLMLGPWSSLPKISLDKLTFIYVQSVQTSITSQFAYLCGNRNYTLVTQQFKCADSCYSKVQKFSLPILNYTDIGDSKTHIYLVTLCRKEERRT